MNDLLEKLTKLFDLLVWSLTNDQAFFSGVIFLYFYIYQFIVHCLREMMIHFQWRIQKNVILLETSKAKSVAANNDLSLKPIAKLKSFTNKFCV